VARANTWWPAQTDVVAFVAVQASGLHGRMQAGRLHHKPGLVEIVRGELPRSVRCVRTFDS
jgi:hypothetical protein